MSALFVVIVLGLFLALVALRDLTQKRHTVPRNSPVVGHLRYLFEELGSRA